MSKRAYLAMAATALVMSGGLGGCTGSRFLTAVLFGGSKTRTVAAEFDGLEDSKVAVLIFTNEQVDFEYPWARQTLSQRIAMDLEKNVDGVTVLDPVATQRYQSENVDWEGLPKTRIGKDLDVDYVLFLSLSEYGHHEPGSSSLYRGRITGDVSVYSVSCAERDAMKWQATGVRTVFPEGDKASLLSGESRRVLARTEELFTDQLVKKFYKHKEEIEP